MKTRTLVGALVAAGVIGGGIGAAIEPISSAHASPAIAAAGVATPAASPGATALPLTGFSELVKRHGPAVVNVSVEGTRRVSSGDGDDDNEIEIPGLQQIPPQFRDFFRGFPRGRGIPRGEAPLMRGQGSGFIVSPDGYIITNAHVVENADHVTVRMTDRREYRAKVVGADKQSDIAILKIDAKNLPTVNLGKSASANVGEWVVAIGSPFGFENSVTAGIVSAKARSLPDANYTQFIQTDVAVNPGNSGGPLFNLAGEVIGINSQIYSRSGGFQGISFAIPIEVAMNVKDQLIKNGKVSRGRIGVTVQEVNATLAESFGLDRPRGALVSSIEQGAPGDKGGLKVGDIITKYDGKSIERSADLPVLVAEVTNDRKVPVEVWRDRKPMTLSVGTTQNQATRVASNDDDDAAPAGRLGVAVRALQPEERSQVKGGTGLVVEQSSGAARRAGIRRGDVLVSINGTPLKTPEELNERVKKAGKSAALLVQRENQQLFVAVELG
ncbi:MAG TPA: Do family serine endopeptidase [Usitatibacter sp.]|nr:Do family serine endopeptidase [Usitatibacter sp.]